MGFCLCVFSAWFVLFCWFPRKQTVTNTVEESMLPWRDKLGGELNSGVTHQRIHIPQIQTFLCARAASVEMKKVV